MPPEKKRKTTNGEAKQSAVKNVASTSKPTSKPTKPAAVEATAPSTSPESSPEPTPQPEDGMPPQPADEVLSVPKTFEDLGIVESLCEACTTMGYTTPTPIQIASIPPALEGRDLIGLAETGSGKTAAFALPILQALLEKPHHMFGLVLAPTRELAYQIDQQFKALGSVIRVNTAVIVGGMDMVSQAIALSKNPHIVVATPGRLLDHLENTKGFSLRNLKYLVMDEADRLLDLDFGPILDKILKALPREGRKTYLFSATMSNKVESLQRASLSNPLRVSVNTSTNKHQTVATLLQSYIFTPQKHKDYYLISLLAGPFSGHSAILFARTVHEVNRLTHLLRALGLGAIPLHGQLSQSSRLSALNKFKAHSRDILVATDVAARGLDIPSVDLVLNFDLPGDSATYVHRVGRTARAGKSGVAISVVTQYDLEVFLRIEKALGQKLAQYEGVTKEETLVFTERVNEAQRVAIRALKDAQEKERNRGGRGNDGGSSGARGGRGGGSGGRGGAKRGREEMDKDEG